VADLQWLKRRDAFLDRPNRELTAEVRFDIEQVLRIHSTMELARRLGSHPQELYEQVWSRLYANPRSPALAADTLERLLGTLYPGEDWKRIERQLGDALSCLRREAQVAWLLAYNSPETLADARDLSDLVLTDVEVDASVETSPITEAIAAIQLYFHRYLTNLEPVPATGDDATRRATFKEQWRWLKNYRVWEANRKVFLYPESYIRPELRDTRTAAFKTLQDDLHQGEITEASVTQAYKKYLDAYTEVSRLIIAGGYVQPDPKNPDDTELTLFGVTRTEPQRYYYRTATFKQDGASSPAVWRSWRALGIDINADRVYPVRAFGRTFVFWTEGEQKQPEGQSLMVLHTKTTGNIQEVTGERQVEHRLKVMYSFYDLSEQWTPPQTLSVFGPAESAQLQGAQLRVTCMPGNDGEESIVVTFQYNLQAVSRSFASSMATAVAAQRGGSSALLPLLGQPLALLVGLLPRPPAKRLTADLTVTDTTAVSLWDGRAEMLQALFDPGEGNNLNLDSVVVLGSTGRHNEALWYSFDLKGGSFLARPVVPPPSQDAEVRLLPLVGNTEGLPAWDHVDACLDTADGQGYLFNNQKMVYYARGDARELGTAVVAPPTSSLIPQQQFQVVSVDSEELVGENGAATNAIDGNPATFWHTEWAQQTAPLPHTLALDLGGSYQVDGFRYLPRQDGEINGTIAGYEFYVSADGSTWGTPVAAGTLAADPGEKTVRFPAKTGHYVRLVALSEINGNPWTSAAELNVFGIAATSAATTNRIDERWGLRYTRVYDDGQVDAAWQRDGVLFLARGDRYVKYSHGFEWVDEEGERGSEAERRADGVPNWSTIDAAFTDSGNTTWFFQGTRYVPLDAKKTFGNETAIEERWGHERNEFSAPAAGAPVVVAAFTRDGHSFLIGPTSYTWYTDSAMLLCERPRPQSLRALLVALNCSNSTVVDEGLTVTGVVDSGTELLFKVSRGTENEIYSLQNNTVTQMQPAAEGGPWGSLAAFVHQDRLFTLTPSRAGVVATVSGGGERGGGERGRRGRGGGERGGGERGGDERLEKPGDMRAAFLGLDGNLYLFGVDRYVQLTPGEISLVGIGNALEQWSSRAVPIAERWGRVRNEFTQGGRVTAAFIRDADTFLVRGETYMRYSGTEYRFVDAGYPKALAGNPDGLPERPFDAAVKVEDRMCYFMGTQHVFGGALTASLPNQRRWGRLRSNILLRGVDTAYRVDNKHYLFSGNEVVCYTASGDGTLPAYMDGAPVRNEFGMLQTVCGAFAYQGFLYLVGPDSFVCCTVDQPEQPLPGYPRRGQARALVADLRQRFHLAPDDADRLAEGRAVYALSLLDSTLVLDTEAYPPGQWLLRLDLSNGQLTREWGPTWINWAALRGEEAVYIDLVKERYSFRADQVMKTDKGVAALWDDSTHERRAIAAVWGGTPFDAAVRRGVRLYLFTDDHYCTLLTAEATDDVGGAVVVKNLQAALAQRLPVRGSFTTLPAELVNGFDAALSLDDRLYLFKAERFASFSGDSALQPVASLQYDLVRLTTSTAARLNRELFIGGVPRLLSLRTQEVDETPGFSVSTSTPTIVRVNQERVNEHTLPLDGHLDFGSANGLYLWEIFFHAPLLIADMLSTAQRFEEAKVWYEYIFDPTEPAAVWKFLPFLTVDVERIVIQIQDRLERLAKAQVNVAALRAVLAPHTAALLAMDAAFQGERDLSATELRLLEELTQLPQAHAQLDRLDLRRAPELQTLRDDLRELVGLIEGLQSRWDSMQTSRAQIETYLDDPFDPHAIAALRPIAYRKAVVMRYLDNLLAWGDMLFSQYTRESINEARMLYVQAWDVLGRRPESLGRRLLPTDCVYDRLRDRDARRGEYDLLLHLEGSRMAALSFAASLPSTPPDALAPPYFFIPPNEELEQYWTRVAARLYKIRHSLNILGVQQPLALFEPPLSPIALVRAVGGAGGLAGLVDGAAAVDVPHYRFSFLVAKAQGLAQKVAQLGSELLGALEKRDAEALSQLQTTQESIILALTRDMQQAQREEARFNLHSLEKAKENAQKRQEVYTTWVNAGYSDKEIAQLSLMSVAALLHTSSSGISLAAAIAAGFPKALIGLFIAGVESPEPEDVLERGAQAIQMVAEGVQVSGEILGITAQHERSVQEWQLQRDLATIDLQQIEAQIEGARWQVEAARQQMVLTERHIAHNEAVSRFYRSKFTNQELYEWMIGRLSDIHYQTYQLALGMARAAERGFQFERGRGQEETRFIQGQQWDSQRKGLLAGYTLGLALDRMEAAFIATDARRFEITKTIALVALDPLAFLKLKAEGVCEFDLGEALFDYDFPGHYCRQVKTIAVDLELGEGVFVNATLTQLTNRVIMEPDPKAVSFLLEPKETPPQTIRTNWKASQQVALSSHSQYEPNSGVFELRFDSERYLPFEGTGAVSRWRLELGGPPGAYDLRNLTGVTITLKYTALQGGEAFAATVRGLLKPTDMLRAFNLSVDFAEAWQDFLAEDSDVLELPLYPEYFPNMASGRIRAIFTHYETDVPGAATFSLDTGQPVPLPDGKTVDTSGLTVRATGTTLRLRLQGDKANLRNVYLVMGYKGGVR
jgi:hypothetical protein